MSNEEQKNGLFPVLSYKIFNEGKCVYTDCKDNQVSECRGCGIGPFCYEHMGGSGFTKTQCWNCIHMDSLEDAIRRYTLENKPTRPEKCPRCKRSNTCRESEIRERTGFIHTPRRIQCSYCRANCHFHQDKDNIIILAPGRKLDCCTPIDDDSTDEDSDSDDEKAD
jgi:hypothetical protein